MRSTPNYESNLAEPSISTIPTGAGNILVFAGQRDEGFYVDLGSAFDLLGLRPFNAAHLAPLATSNGVDATAGYNVHTIAIQVPTQLLTQTGALPKVDRPTHHRRLHDGESQRNTRLTLMGHDGDRRLFLDGDRAPATCGQVSRLGNTRL